MESKRKTVKAVESTKPVETVKPKTPAGEKLAVLALSGSQYLVREGSELTVNHLELKDGKSVKAAAVILKPKFGNGSVTYKLLEQKKGPKILVMKYKAKSRYRKKRGFRAQLSKIVIEKIEA
jgi:large subunit ribosomal protein L21